MKIDEKDIPTWENFHKTIPKNIPIEQGTLQYNHQHVHILHQWHAPIHKNIHTLDAQLRESIVNQITSIYQRAKKLDFFLHLQIECLDLTPNNDVIIKSIHYVPCEESKAQQELQQILDCLNFSKKHNFESDISYKKKPSPLHYLLQKNSNQKPTYQDRQNSFAQQPIEEQPFEKNIIESEQRLHHTKNIPSKIIEPPSIQTSNVESSQTKTDHNIFDRTHMSPEQRKQEVEPEPLFIHTKENDELLNDELLNDDEHITEAQPFLIHSDESLLSDNAILDKKIDEDILHVDLSRENLDQQNKIQIETQDIPTPFETSPKDLFE